MDAGVRLAGDDNNPVIRSSAMYYKAPTVILSEHKESKDL